MQAKLYCSFNMGRHYIHDYFCLRESEGLNNKNIMPTGCPIHVKTTISIACINYFDSD